MPNDPTNPIIEAYAKDERMMVLVFAQWCVNHDLDPKTVYREAYPDQADNGVLLDAIALTVPKKEAGDIATQTVIRVLELFGNEGLAYVVGEKAKQ